MKQVKKKRDGVAVAPRMTVASHSPSSSLLGWAAVFFHKPVVHLLFIVVLGFLIYSNTFHGPFVFDDEIAIVENSGIKDLGNYSSPLSGNRSIGFLTFALNYKLHGLHVTGYHVVNLLIHLINALLVYGLSVLTFRTPYGYEHFQEGAVSGSAGVSRWLPMFVALLFVSHPVQTQAVTYIVQRFASLATLFYLASLVMYLKARESGPSGKAGYAFYAASILAAILAMRTKEISFTLPVVIILYELMFFKKEIKRRVLYLFPFLLTLSIIPLSLMGWNGSTADTSVIDELSKATRTAGVDSVSRWDYLNTQFRVIITYLRLLVFPVNQNLDYDYPIYRSFFDPAVLLSFLFLLALFVLGVYMFYKSKSCGKEGGEGFYLRVVSFGIFWFFVTLSVESSIIPIKDVINEHRLYLSSVGFFMASMAVIALMRAKLAGQTRVFEQVFIPVLVMAVLGLSLSAYARNRVWQDGITFWEDVLKKSPNKVRAYHNLGLMYAAQSSKDRLEKAITLYQEAIKREPDHVEAHNNLGMAYYEQGRFDDAIKEISAASKLRPGYADAHNNLGLIYFGQGRFDEALQEYQTAIKYRSDFAKAYNNLAILCQRQNRQDDAFQAIQAAIKYNPEYAEARNTLGVLYLKQGRFDDAIVEIKKAITCKPDYTDAYFNLGAAYRKMGKLADAEIQFQTVLKIDPSNEDAYYSIEILRGNMKEFKGTN
ncbi:MAG: tetratricopeptide repeat protein [Syntrophales bacterium]